MKRPFFYTQASGLARLTNRLIVVPGSGRARRVYAALNPLDGLPAPIPARRPLRADSLAVGDTALPAQERAMRNLWWDGFFAEVSETVWLQYFALYALMLGASVGLIGALAAIGSLLAAASMWPGAHVAERTRRYKFIVLLTGGGLGRLAFLALALLPWIVAGNVALALLVAIAAFRGFISSIAMPAWNAFAADFVPPRLRGRYFASRNFARQVAELATAPLVGLLIAQSGVVGWQIAWLLAFAFGIVSSVFYSRIPNDVTEPAQAGPASAEPNVSRSVLRDTRLTRFVATTALFHLAVMIAGPFFSIYMVRELGGDAFWVGLSAAMLPVGGLLAQRLLGRLNDRFGPKSLLVASGLLLPFAPLGWLVATEPWHILLLNLFAGALWPANLLGTFNLVLAIAPPARRPTYSAMQQAGLFIAAFAGPLLGGLLISTAGFHAVFLLSSGGRWIATLLLWRTVAVAEPWDREEGVSALEPAPAA